MKLKDLLYQVPCLSEIPDIEVQGITSDSRELEPGWVFVCRKGLRFDGHEHAQEALRQGACAVVCERDLGLEAQVVVQNTQDAYAVLCANFFGRPADHLKLIGVTGTNGKTTSAFLVKHILTQAGKQTGLIGTVQNEIGTLVLPARFTTPDPYQLHSMLAQMLRFGCEYVVMEVSSHALAQGRVHGLHFACGIFTNLTQDHLDYHHTMEEYFAAKQSLFLQCDTAVLNTDDPYGKRIAQQAACRVVRCSLEDDSADYVAKNIRSRVDGSCFAMMTNSGLEKVKLPMPGKFSIYNALGALGCCIELGVPAAQAAAALESCHGVTGRFEVIPTGLDFTVVRDYAHTTDGIEKILSTVQELGAKRVITLFGCAGCRDSSKRADMGETAAKYSDFVILTSDNPREEPEQQIIDHALPGVLRTKKPYRVILDRYEAIAWALSFCQAGDILMLLGKGHEDYQVLDYGSIYFNEREIVQQLAKKLLQEEQA